MAEQSAGIRPGGGEALVYNDKVWSELRAAAGVPDDFVNAGWSTDQLTAGGGKGGTLMCKVGTTFLVKELNAGDHKSLLNVTQSYYEHVRSGATLICPIYLHYEDSKTKRMFFVMKNCIGGCADPAEMYDLKGCADDKALIHDGSSVKTVHKRFFNVGMWMSQSSWTPERKRYWEGKKHAGTVDFPVSSSQKAWVCGAIKRDCDWLARNRLMDYSLLVAVKRGPVGAMGAAGGAAPSDALRPLVRKRPDGDVEAVYVGIIDILQKWTNGKRVARVIKFAECNKATVPPRDYANRFTRHFEKAFADIVEEASVVQAGADRGAPVAPPAGSGDPDDMPHPEERLDSRPMQETGGADDANDRAAKGVANQL